MKFNVLSLTLLLTVFALNIKAEESKKEVTPAAEVLTDAQKIAAKTAEEAAKKAEAAAKYAKSFIGQTEAYVKGIPAKVSKAANDFVTAANMYANNVAVNGVSMVKTHKVETAVVAAAITGYIAALNGVFGKKIEKFTNKYKQFVAGAATVASAVLLYNLATTTPAVVTK